MKGITGFIILAAAALCATAQPAYARDEIPEADGPSRQELLDSIRNLHKDFESQKKNYEKTIKGLEKDLEKSRGETERLKNKSELAKAEDTIASLRLAVDSLTGVIDAGKASAESLSARCRAAEDSLSGLSAELQSLLVFRKAYLLDLFKDSEEYLRLPYSRIDADSLRLFKGDLSEYAADKEVSDAIARIDDAIKYKGYVDDMSSPLHNPYNVAAINKARASFTQLKKNRKAFSDAQWAEFDTLDIYLSRYTPAQEAFKAIITKTNKIVGDYDDANGSTLRDDCSERIQNEVILPYEKWEIEGCIDNIPYIKERFDKYLRWIKTDPLNKTKEIKEIEAEIMDQTTE